MSGLLYRKGKWSTKDQNHEEARRWLSQAKSDLKVARWDFEGGFWWEVCFLSQKIGEKALKAFRYYRGERFVVSHSLVDIVRGCVRYSPDLAQLEPMARRLDKYYISARYPNGLRQRFLTRKRQSKPWVMPRK